MMTTQVLEMKTGPHILVRAVWYILIGWWVTGIGMVLAYLAALTILGLPLSFWLVNRIPTMLTLRPRRERYLLVAGADGVTRMKKMATQQTNVFVRIGYFILVGWWLSAIAMAVAYVLMLTVIGIPFGMMVVNRLPFAFTLHRGYA